MTVVVCARGAEFGMSLQNTCRFVVGRVLEINVCAGYRAVADVDEMIAMMGQAFAGVPEPTRIVIAADWRTCRIFTPDVAERVVLMLSRSNPRVERSAILHASGQATSVLQVLRLAREAQFQQRRVFTEPSEMLEWLSEILTPPERERLQAFLAGQVG
jgi:hypothetical protein